MVWFLIQSLLRRKVGNRKSKEVLDRSSIVKDPGDGITEAIAQVDQERENLESLGGIIQSKMKYKRKKVKIFDKKVGWKNLTSQSPKTPKRKRKFNVADEEVIGSKKKKSMAASRDRISELPEPIIHHILSLLRNPKDIVRTRILSKRWRDVHNSFNILKFDQRNFTKGSRNKHSVFAAGSKKVDLFSYYVTRGLENHLHQGIVIQKIELNMTSYDLNWAQNMDQWLSIASDSKIRELDLCFPSSHKMDYNLCTNVFTISTLTSLRLIRCKLGPCREIKLPNLRRLCLGNINVSEYAIQNLIHGCPLIEDLRFISCSGLKKLHVSGLTELNKLELYQCHRLKTIEVDAPNLHTFWHYSERYANLGVAYRYNLDSCTSLRSLTLHDATINSEAFLDLLLNFTWLETLELSQCDSLVDILIDKLSLKRLVLRGCKMLRTACISAPNLSSFGFEGNLLGDEIPFLSLNPYALKEAKFTLTLKCSQGNVDNARVWHSRLCDYLTRFDHSAGLVLVIYSKKVVIVHEDLKEILFPPANTFTIEVVGSSKRLEDVLGCSLQALHPKILCVVSSVNGALLQLISRVILERDANPKCCEMRTFTNKCWRHFLKDVRTEVVTLSGVLGVLSFDSWFIKSPSVFKKTSFFRFTWKPKSEGGMLK